MAEPASTGSGEPAPERASLDVIHDATRSWWVVAVIGALSVIAGVVVLVRPSHSLTVLVVVCGIFIVVSSLLELVVAVGSRLTTAALVGVLGVVVGILLIRHPLHGVLAAALLVGLWFVAVGLMRLLDALTMERGRWALASAALEIVAGIVLVAVPHVGFVTLAVLVGIAFVLNGIVLLGLGIVFRALHQATGAAASPGE